tara:strand:+ start:248 stop:820 length:573 start_codon:yes stop_codon:yes gene_type:complete
MVLTLQMMKGGIINMETIKIVSCLSKPTQNGKDRWEAMSNDGRKLGIWDLDLAKLVICNIDKQANVTIKVNGLYNNLMTFMPLAPQEVPQTPQTQATMPVNSMGSISSQVVVPKETPTTPLPSMGMFATNTDRSIARATIFNAAVSAVTAQIDFKLEGDGPETEFGRDLVSAINELTAAYNYTNEQVKAL